MQQCKKHLNNEAVEDTPQQATRNVQAVAVHAHDDAEDDVNITKVEASTHSTNASDDYAHRGTPLRTMPLYIYRMFVRRIPKPGATANTKASCHS